MTVDNEDRITLAAEYALGTLDAEERAQVEAMISADADFAAMVESWNNKLGSLNQMVGSVEPSAELWDRIKAAVGISGPQKQFELPAEESPAVVEPPVVVAPVVVPPAANDATGRVVKFERKTGVWRSFALASSAIAASLLAIVGIQLYQPDLLPAAMRPKPRTEIVRVTPPAAPAPVQYVAVLEKDGGAPAFIMSVDATRKKFTTRAVAAAEVPGKSYELWIVSDKLPKPRSLGVIGTKDYTTSVTLAAYDPDLVNKATYAVTIEPPGGSPTGSATGPIVFTGKLIETMPISQ